MKNSVGKTEVHEGLKPTQFGSLPEDWQVVPLAHVLEEVDVRAADFDDLEDFPVLSLTKNYGLILQSERFDKRIATKDISNYKVVKKEWIVYNPYVIWEGAIHMLCRHKTGLVSPVYPAWECQSDRVIPYFLDALLRMPFAISAYNRFASGAVNRRRSIRKKDFLKITIPLPLIPEQKKIAAVLSAVQEAKEKTEEIIKATKELKKSLMKHLFTYGPVPVEEAENVPLKETEIGLVPKEWDVDTLRSCLQLNESGVWGDDLQEGEIGTDVLRSTNIQDRRWVFEDVALRRLTAQQLIRYQLRAGDILITKSSGSKKHIGKAAYVDDSVEQRKAAFSNFMQRVRFNERIWPKFGYFFITSDKGQKALLRRSTTTTGLRNLTKGDIENLMLPLPPLPEQKKIAEILSAVDKKIEAEENKKKTLEELFKTLLNNLITAKIRVNHLEIPV